MVTSSRVLAADLPRHVGDSVCLAGWVHRLRQLKSVAFLVLRDRSGLAQVVVPPDTVLPAETVVEVRGVVTENAQAPDGVELTRPSITLLSEPAVTPPFDLYRPELSATLPTILDHASIALRHPKSRARFAVAAAGVSGFRSTLDGCGFTEIHTPKIVGSATESGANVFELDYFGRRAYLAQSPQLFKQAMVGVFERVYEVGPVFRAEPHDTARHLAQYTSLDAEFGFIEDHRDVMALLREVLAGMTAAIAERVPGVALPRVPAEIPVLHFAEAQEMLGRDDPDLAPEHERSLSDWAKRTHDSEFLFVTGYPSRKRPFYTHPEPDRPGYTNSFDLLFRGLELVTGGQRLHRHADYLTALAERGMDAGPYRGYLDTFAHGMPPHGGFAIGLERWVARVLGLDNVRYTTLFPRDLHRLSP
ncbi:aspartate--tRNA(Asn) ligase [Amycolatopsis magusensis]|uniref:aspartate--tRNA(Asn) ligase n=1 Tax=Amycolatopsis magusensis TaxID=882444 RepID=UPI0024A7FCEB|nr:aspartate--tRNA(Asn) ligase [Amycolatopsis magusensis]MDI5975094.1 aspartate--tRNA(Asn) ligase [Amycolatopsis magusensis]